MLRPTGEGGETTKKRRRKPEPKSEPKRRRTSTRTSQPREREPRKRLPQKRISNYQPEMPVDPEVFSRLLESLHTFEPAPTAPLGGDFSLTPRTSPNLLDQRDAEPWRAWLFPWMLEQGEM